MTDTRPGAPAPTLGDGVDAQQNGTSATEEQPVPEHAPEVSAQSQGGSEGAQPPIPPGDSGDGIAGMSVLRGLIVYTAVLVFAALYVDFIVLISRAKPNQIPVIGSAKITAAAALAGVLGSAFALRVGNPSAQPLVNLQLDDHLAKGRKRGAPKRTLWASYVHRALSLEASHRNRKSWPVTAGIWIYAAVATAVAITYALNEAETPPMVKALAVAFAGYVIAFLSVAFGVHSTAS